MLEELQKRIQALEAQLASYHDQNVSVWAHASVLRGIAKGVMHGDEHGNMNPKEPVTREQLMVILDRLGLLG
ncbi:S-layer homology domain-containing protein [Fodinisporobacter ferrooxydans]|uniref:S-layer homology domain-containing protein n=1 Tax=Fodinisporobacter ferrooxydans TaxID=2901836 RepID=A0ABY4CED1_9BACL|nr:S-layer homology domain-containing protein [Alicyclobacillaceae bacterium MYW30-H2]